MEPLRIHQSINNIWKQASCPNIIRYYFQYINMYYITEYTYALVNSACIIVFVHCTGNNTIHINNTYHLLSADCSSDQIEFQLTEYWPEDNFVLTQAPTWPSK